MDRGALSTQKKLLLASKTVIILIKSIAKREITFKQLTFDLRMRFFNTQKHLNDDFDWTQYHKYYAEELKSISKLHSLILDDKSFYFSENKIERKSEKVKPLHANHQLLYETIARLKPTTVREVGCGGGDHLTNLNFILPNAKLFGIDRSDDQLKTFRARHPDLEVDLSVVDVTNSESVLSNVEVSYTQAVLMHISESNNRLNNALENILASTTKSIVLLENWTQHNFYQTLYELKNNFEHWCDSKFYLSINENFPEVRCLILSRVALNFPQLDDYEELLLGQNLLTH